MDKHKEKQVSSSPVDEIINETNGGLLDQDSNPVSSLVARMPATKSAIQLPLVRLPKIFAPTPYDVICGRGPLSRHHVGNHRFLASIERNAKIYAKAGDKISRSTFVISIVDDIRHEASMNGGAGFVRQEVNGYWVETGDVFAREKVSRAFRDFLKSRKRRKELIDQRQKAEGAGNGSSQGEKISALLKRQQDILLASILVKGEDQEEDNNK